MSADVTAEPGIDVAEGADEREIVELDGAPNLGALYARAALSAFGRGGDELPRQVLRRTGITADPGNVADYAEVCGFRVSDEIPTTYAFVLTFPMAVQLMLDRTFPFGIVGMVHLGQTFEQHRPLRLDETFDVDVHLANLRPHAKGRMVDVVSAIRSDGETVISAVTTVLKRGASNEGVAPDGTAASLSGVDLASLGLTSTWRVSGKQIRTYAGVSGDVNPIHLYPITAKALGFSKPIAHGMWSAAAAVAGLEGRLPDARRIEVAFKLPMFVPGTFAYVTEQVGDAWHLGVRGRSRGDRPGKPHVVARVTPLG